MAESFAKTWKEIAIGFLQVGATAYGGPAIMGIMQADFQERRQWTSKAHFLEGLALVNVLPGATATQLTIFFAALFRLGKSALRSRTQAGIAVGAAAAALVSPLGAAAILVLSGGVGLFLFHGKRLGAILLLGSTMALVVLPALVWSRVGSAAVTVVEPRLGRIAALFGTIGALTFGGGLTMIALMQEHVVDRLHWLTPREFVDGLALGQLTPGPVLMLAAYVGYKPLGVAGAVVAAAASFVPSFVLMLGLLPVFDRVRSLTWARAVMQGLVPGVIGVMAVALVRMTPHAAPDPPAVAALVVAGVVLIVWRIAPPHARLRGSVFGLLRESVWGR